MKEQNIQQKQKNTNEQQLFLKNRNGNISINGKVITPRAEEGYCNETTESGPLTHSQSHQAQNGAEHKTKLNSVALVRQRTSRT